MGNLKRLIITLIIIMCYVKIHYYDTYLNTSILLFFCRIIFKEM